MKPISGLFADVAESLVVTTSRSSKAKELRTPYAVGLPSSPSPLCLERRNAAVKPLIARSHGGDGECDAIACVNLLSNADT